jgi:hypothetical protein
MLRVAYWTGAILDALTIVPMVSPPVGAAMFGLRDFHPGPDYRYAMGLAASLMLGWTCLLIWADRKPLARRGVLILTVVPVIAGLFASGVYAVASGMVELRYLLPMFVIQVLVSAFFLSAYIRSNEAAAAP